jgi:hypothetical protein
MRASAELTMEYGLNRSEKQLSSVMGSAKWCSMFNVEYQLSKHNLPTEIASLQVLEEMKRLTGPL